jgi:L-ascorbate metabolism protein UlaG (beta-lactamase superfamily)
MASLTWLGHGSFRLDTDGGNAFTSTPGSQGRRARQARRSPSAPTRSTSRTATGDHVGDVVDLQKKLGCKVLAMVELAGWLSQNGAGDDVIGFNKGGTVELDVVQFTMTNAFHSGSTPDGSYGGEPTGVVIREGSLSIYFAGDTCMFGDMELIARLYKPQVVVLPIGDHYTMGPEEAALALELLGNPRCVPAHWGTFPLLTDNPDALAALKPAQVERIQPGDTVQM